MKLELKPIAQESIPRALEKAERYRLLNEPFLAESICLDVLAVDGNNRQALVTYALALSDQFGGGGSQDGAFVRAMEAVQRLPEDYERLHYAGILHERRGQAYAESGGLGAREAAWEHIEEAMELYEKAQAIHPAGNDDAILRWNTCVRLIAAHRLTRPSRERHEYPLE